MAAAILLLLLLTHLLRLASHRRRGTSTRRATRGCRRTCAPPWLLRCPGMGHALLLAPRPLHRHRHRHWHRPRPTPARRGTASERGAHSELRTTAGRCAGCRGAVGAARWPLRGRRKPERGVCCVLVVESPECRDGTAGRRRATRCILAGCKAHTRPLVFPARRRRLNHALQAATRSSVPRWPKRPPFQSTRSAASYALGLYLDGLPCTTHYASPWSSMSSHSW